MANKSAKKARKKLPAGRKPAAKTKRASRPKPTRKSSTAKSRSASRTRKKAVGRKTARPDAKPAARKPTRPAPRTRKSSSKKAKKKGAGAAVSGKPAARKASRAAASRGFRRRAGFESPETTRGLGPETGGQSGDTEGLSRSELADSESVEELLEEGQAYEAGIVSGVENTPDADEGEVRTRQVPEDDVPQEYLDRD